MRLWWWGIGAACAALGVGCDVRETGGDELRLRGEVRAALAPLRGALQGIAQEQREVRLQMAELSLEVAGALVLIDGSIDAGARPRAAALAVRMQQLEQELRVQAEAGRRDQELMLRALETTAEKLDAFLQRFTPQAAPSEAPVERALPEPAEPGRAPTSTNGEQGAQDATLALWWWGAGSGLLVAGLAVAAALRRRRRRTAVRLDDAPVEGFAGLAPVLVPVPAPLDAAAHDGLAPPPEIRQELDHARPDAVGEVLARWLEADPRVLVFPPPRVEAGSRSVRARYHLAPGLAHGEAARIEAEVAALARDCPAARPGG